MTQVKVGRKLARLLRQHGVKSEVLAAIKQELSGSLVGPRLSRATVARIRRLCTHAKDRCVITLCRTGKHRVFRPEAHVRLQKNMAINRRKRVSKIEKTLRLKLKSTNQEA